MTAFGNERRVLILKGYDYVGRTIGFVVFFAI
jgi:hypothetical protein